MEGGFRVDDTPVHRALREALENPGYIRLGKEQMRRGGKSDPRNKVSVK